MVKRDDARETSPGRVRDTDLNQIPLVGDLQGEEPDDLPEGCYKPEMGTIVVNEYRGPLDEA
jgi:hypothetical protein